MQNFSTIPPLLFAAVIVVISISSGSSHDICKGENCESLIVKDYPLSRKRSFRSRFSNFLTKFESNSYALPTNGAYQQPSSSTNYQGPPQQYLASGTGFGTGSTGSGCGFQAPGYEPWLGQSRHRIINGQNSKPHSWPWQVIVQSGGGSCGGTLIAPDVVLTAAHCLKGRAANARVTAAAHHLFGHSDETVTVSARGLVHPKYVHGQIEEFDIALLKLEHKIELSHSIRTACLAQPMEELPSGTDCVITGWGRIRANTGFMDIELDANLGPSTPTTLQEAYVPIMDQEQCRSILGDRITNKMLCAGGGKSDTCQGDSGGPLVCRHDGGRWVLHGVTSFGFSCGKEGQPGVYTRVSSYVSWINEMLGGV